MWFSGKKVLAISTIQRYNIIARLCAAGAGWESVRDPELKSFSISKQIWLSASSEIPVDKAESVLKTEPSR